MASPPSRTGLADTYPNPSNATFKTAIGALWDWLTSVLGNSGSAGNRNRIHNANFAINQREKSGTVALSVGQYGHDRWKAGASGCTYTFAWSGRDVVITITAGSLIQTIESNDVEGGQYALSHAGTSLARIGINGSAAAGSYAAATASAPLVTPSATGGLAINVEFSTGTISKAQLEPGTIATAFERRPYAQDLAICQRYARPLTFATVGSAGIATTAYSTASVIGAEIQIPEMRATPSGGVVTNSALYTKLGVAVGGSSFSVVGASPRSISVLQGGTPTLVAGDLYYFGVTAASSILLSADL